MRRKLAIGAAIVTALLLVVVTRAVWEGRSQLANGDAALQAGDVEKSIRHYRRAARWYVPLAPHVDSAYDRLTEIATAAEGAGNTPDALAAWRAIRRSILATRSFYTPQKDRLARANERIAELMAAQELSQGIAPKGGSAETRSAFHLALLTRPEAPSVLWSIIALLGFGLWVGGAVWFCLRGLDDDDRLVKRVAARSGGLIIIGLVTWMLGLHLA